MKSYLTILLLSFFLFGCGGKHAELEYQFNKILYESKSLETEGIKALITQESHDYIQTLAEMSDSLNLDWAEQYGLQHNIPLITMRLHAQSVSTEPDSEEKFFQGMSKEDIILMIMKLTGTGIMSLDASKRIKYKEAAGNDQTADVIAVVSTSEGSNTKIISSYKFRKEQDEWKIDILSTFTLQEKILKQSMQQKGGTTAEFIMDHVANPPETMGFQYHTYMK